MTAMELEFIALLNRHPELKAELYALLSPSDDG